MKIDKKKFLTWLQSQWVGPKNCPICQKNQWAIGDAVGEIREYNKEGFILGGPNSSSYPNICVVCTTCGYTMLINAIVSGFVVMEEPTETKKEDQNG